MFNPTLQSDVGYERPVAGAPAAPSMFEGLIQAASGFIQASGARSGGSAPRLREDEEYAIALSAELKAMGAAGRPDNPNYRANLKNTFSSFVRKYPQFTSQHSAFMSSQGIEITAPVTERVVDEEETALVKFTATPLGQVADQAARREATDANGTFDSAKYESRLRQAYADEMRTQASIQSLDRSVASNDQYWRIGENAAKALVLEELDFAAGLWETIQAGQSVALPPDVAASVGWTGGEINAKNVALFMNRYRPVLANQIATATRGYLISNGAAGDLVTEPNAEWYTRVMGPIDDIISAANTQLGDPKKVMEWYKSAGGLNARIALEQTEEGRQVLAAGDLISSFDPELRAVLSQTLAVKLSTYDYEPFLNRIIMLSNTSTPNPTRTDAGVNALSVEEATRELEISVNAIGSGAIPKDKVVGYIDRTISLENRVNPTSVLGMETWNKIFGVNAKEITSYASANPAFAEKVATFMLSDMQKNWVELEKLASENRFVLTITPSGVQVGYPDNLLSSAERNNPSLITNSKEFKAFNTKLQSLGQFGEIGQQVLGVLQPPAPAPQGTGLELIRQKEGFRETPYWDEDAYRIGYGSDTITRADGTIVKVEPGMRITREDAERDLARRYNTEFLPRARNQVGPAWDSYPTNVHDALVSIAYNYGSLPGRILEAARSGDVEALATAVEGLAGDNNGINRNRRLSEAALIRGTPYIGDVGRAMGGVSPVSQQALSIPLGGTTNTLATDAAAPTPVFQSTRTGAPEMAPRTPTDESASTPAQMPDPPTAVSTEALEAKRYQWRDRQLNQLILSLSEAQGLMQDTYQFDTEEDAYPYLESGLLEDKLVVIGGKVFKVDREQ